jgi:hypothetical protein
MSASTDTGGFLIIAKGAEICYTMLSGSSKPFILLEVEGGLVMRFLGLAILLTVALLVVASLPLAPVGAQP